MCRCDTHCKVHLKVPGTIKYAPFQVRRVGESIQVDRGPEGCINKNICVTTIQPLTKRIIKHSSFTGAVDYEDLKDGDGSNYFIPFFF